MVVASAQGGLDGLCGVCAPPNSARHVRGRHSFNSAEERKCFESIGAFLDGRAGGLRTVALDGTDEALLGAIMAAEGAELGLVFTRQGMPGRKDYWFDSARELLQPPKRCLIVGTAGRLEHWTVVTGVTEKKLVLMDGGRSHINLEQCKVTGDAEGQDLTCLERFVWVVTKKAE
jgi:hypothetical protein